MLAKLRTVAHLASRDPNSSMRLWFAERCVANVRFVFAFSPVGPFLRAQIRACPALVACTTVDWYDPWPVDALRAVARYELGGLEGLEPKVLDAVVDVCVTAHVSATDLSKRYEEATRRVVHVTPTHYLSLLALLQRLLDEKRRQLRDEKGRFDDGLRQLLRSAESVADMQAELETLKPELIVKSMRAEEVCGLLPDCMCTC